MTIAATISTGDAVTGIWDVIIIGAGPAGSTLALALQRHRLRVLLVDQSQFPRAKVCGGCLNGAALAALNQLRLALLPAQLGAMPIHHLQLASWQRTAGIRLRDGVSLSREVFDAALVHECIRSGVDFLPGVRATLGDLDGNARQVHLRCGTVTQSIRGRVIILAHGLQSGTVAAGSWIGAGVVLEDVIPDFPAGTIRIAIGDGGYVGAVRVERDRIDFAAALDPKRVKRHGSIGAAAMSIMKQAGVPVGEELASAPWKGTPHLTRRADSIAGTRWFSVGDAAGYVEPFTGEGIAWAMTGALALAPIVVKSVQTWNDSDARRWSHTHSRIVRRQQWPCRILAKMLHSPRLSSVLVQGLSICPALAVPFVRSRNPLTGVAS